MMIARRSTLCLLVVLLLPLGGYLFRSRRLERHLQVGNLREATKEELVAKINAEAAKIKTLNATVDIAASVGGEKKGKVTDYQDIKGYMLVREPDQLRLIGLFPVVRNKAFDMVSDGTTFKLSIPARARFILGTTKVRQPA